MRASAVCCRCPMGRRQTHKTGAGRIGRARSRAGRGDCERAKLQAFRDEDAVVARAIRPRPAPRRPGRATPPPTAAVIVIGGSRPLARLVPVSISIAPNPTCGTQFQLKLVGRRASSNSTSSAETLTVLDFAVNLPQATQREATVDAAARATPPSYQILARSMWSACFQWESKGMRRAAGRHGGPTRFRGHHRAGRFTSPRVLWPTSRPIASRKQGDRHRNSCTRCSDRS